MTTLNRNRLLKLVLTLSVILTAKLPAYSATRAEMRSEARTALNELYGTTPAARHLRDSARAVLVFPKIVKAGFVIGGQHGDGTLFVKANATGYYKSVAASYGLQAGIQRFGYALFFMTDEDLDYLRKSGGWELGSGPSLVIVDEGKARTFSTTTLRKGVYAFVFGQRGLMAGVGLQGTKITPINPR